MFEGRLPIIITRFTGEKKERSLRGKEVEVKAKVILSFDCPTPGCGLKVEVDYCIARKPRKDMKCPKCGLLLNLEGSMWIIQ